MKIKLKYFIWIFLISLTTSLFAQKPETTKANQTENQSAKKLQSKNEKFDQSENQILNNKTNDSLYTSWSVNWVSIIISFSFFLLIFIIMKMKISFLTNQLKELQKSRERHRNDIDSILDNNSTHKSIPSYGYKNSRESKIEQDIHEIKSHLSKLDNSLASLRNQILMTESSKTKLIYDKESTEPITKSEILYASIPTKDGLFTENAVSNTINPTASFYKFVIIDTLGQKAKFEFLGNEERAVKDATNSPERILKPACKINNALNQNAKRIKTTSPGIVIKKDGKWEVDTLAEIEYE